MAKMVMFCKPLVKSTVGEVSVLAKNTRKGVQFTINYAVLDVGEWSVLPPGVTK